MQILRIGKGFVKVVPVIGLSLRNLGRKALRDISIDRKAIWGTIEAWGLYVEFSDG